MLADFYIYNPCVRYDGDFPSAFLLLVLKRVQHAKNGELVVLERLVSEGSHAHTEWASHQYYQDLGPGLDQWKPDCPVAGHQARSSQTKIYITQHHIHATED